VAISSLRASHGAIAHNAAGPFDRRLFDYRGGAGTKQKRDHCGNRQTNSGQLFDTREFEFTPQRSLILIAFQLPEFIEARFDPHQRSRLNFNYGLPGPTETMLFVVREVVSSTVDRGTHH